MLRYAISDRSLLLRQTGESLVDQAKRLARQKVDFLLLREKDLPTAELLALAEQVRTACLGASMRVLVSSRVDVALAAELDGVHLTSSQGELRPDQVQTLYRKLGRAEPFVSVSCHTLAEVLAARGHGASAILFAPVFGKVVDGKEVVAGAGLQALRAACEQATPVPVFALGGVTAATSAACLQAGAHGIAGIRNFLGSLNADGRAS